MPLYEYECRACHKRTEKIQKFSDPEITICPHCGGELDRTVTAPAFQFSGGGWYKDGYGNAKPAESGGDSKSGDSKSSDSKSDTPVAAAASADSTSTAATASAPAAPATAAPAAPSSPAKS
jgi:putative FmdB family regulatory protein